VIAPVSVSTAAIRESWESRQGRELTALHGDLTEALVAHGMLVFASDDAASDFREALRELEQRDPNALKKWEAAVAALHANRRMRRYRPPIAVPLEQVEDLPTLRTNWRSALGVAVVDDERAGQLGVPDDAWSQVDPDSKIDVARPAAGWRCETFRTLREITNGGCLLRGTRREEAWERIFAPLARQAGHLYILDRYAASNIVRRYNDERADRYPVTALGWLLQKIDASARKDIQVSIFSGDDVGGRPGEPATIAEFEDAVRSVWGGVPGGAAIARIDLHAASWQVTRSLPHDRHIRFDLGCVIELPAGLDRLDKETLNQDVTIAYRWLSDPLRKAENAEQAVRTDRSAEHAVIE
jgi:hypothetical protein